MNFGVFNVGTRRQPGHVRARINTNATKSTALTEADLLGRMKNFEDHLVERKTVRDEKDWKKTAVAFANSVPVGLLAVLYIGVRNNGEIENPQANMDEIQKKFNQRIQRVYPQNCVCAKNHHRKRTAGARGDYSG